MLTDRTLTAIGADAARGRRGEEGDAFLPLAEPLPAVLR